MEQQMYEEVIKANIIVHSKMADRYNENEPHFRPENILKVETTLKQLFKQTNAEKLLDMGCGTGFIINIAKKYVSEITGIDITQAMLDKIDKSGKANIELFKQDIATFQPEKGSYDIVTGYAFLHHLFNIKPALTTAFKSLKKGGALYIDLEPNFYFWECIGKLQRDGIYDPIVNREIEMVTYKDEDVQKNFGVDRGVFDKAEYGKNINGGFKEEDLKATLTEIGFTKIDYNYNWYIGQAYLKNNYSASELERIKYSQITDEILKKILPMSRNLFKYISFVAFK